MKKAVVVLYMKHNTQSTSPTFMNKTLKIIGLGIAATLVLVGVFLNLFSQQKRLDASAITLVKTDSLDKDILWIGTRDGLKKALVEGTQLRGLQTFLRGEEITDVVFDSPNEILIGSRNGIYKMAPDGTQLSNLTATQFGEVHVVAVTHEPNDPRKIYAVVQDGLIRSKDGGITWTRIREGLNLRYTAPWGSELTYNIISTSLHQTLDSDTIYVGTNGTGIFKIRIDQDFWVPVNTGLSPSIGAAPIAPVESIAVDPHNPDTVYITLEVKGIFKSVDGGQNWIRLTQGLPETYYHRTAPSLVSIGKTDRVVAAINRPLLSQIEGAVFLSINSGQSWQKIARFGEAISHLSIIDSTSDILFMVDEQIIWLTPNGDRFNTVEF
ncbi:hypothetical protein MYX78_00205 [Acidobacteria bacterium AH-259-G07]|nr:hypothetical protein [Acidobacteria bacterium AH-259-G07]